MNPLTHAHFALELFKDQELTQDQKDHLIVGSIIPDIHITGLIQYQKTHNYGLDFFHSLKNPLHKYFALGMITHGEEPKGLDYYTHNRSGFIEQKQSLIAPLAKKYRKHLGKINNWTIHFLIEFSVETLVTEKDSSIVPQVTAALQNPKIKSAITAFSNFFGFSERKNRKIIYILNHKYLRNYISNFSSPETTSQNWLNLTFIRNFKKGKNLPFREKFKKLSKFFYYNIKRKISDKYITQLLYEINSHLREDAHSFLLENQKKLTPLKNELLPHISSQKR